jgi:hypothetical protein
MDKHYLQKGPYSLIRNQRLKSRDKIPQYYKTIRMNIHGPRQETFECVTRKGEGKVSFCSIDHHAMKMYVAVEVYSHAFLTSAPDRYNRSA